MMGLIQVGILLRCGYTGNVRGRKMGDTGCVKGQRRRQMSHEQAIFVLFWWGKETKTEIL